MDEQTLNDSVELASKIARLVQERGWNQEDFARIADLNRHTVRRCRTTDALYRIGRVSWPALPPRPARRTPYRGPSR